jgi:small subunit ribosomal protein S21
MLRRFKKKVERADILQEVKKREYYEKPAQKRQRKKKEAVRKEQIRWEADQLPSQRYGWY